SRRRVPRARTGDRAMTAAPNVLTQIRAALADRYRIERELGQGGMATVYLAQDLKHDRKVAVKGLRPELAAVLGAERFLAEIKVTANLQHPNLLPLFDSGAAGGRDPHATLGAGGGEAVPPTLRSGRGGGGGSSATSSRTSRERPCEAASSASGNSRSTRPPG